MTRTQQILSCFVILAGLANFACSGEECSATSSAFSDTDSDCVDDSGDNCVGFYNPDQFDGDEDGLGYICDYDDTDDSIAFVKEDLIEEDLLQNPSDSENDSLEQEDENLEETTSETID